MINGYKYYNLDQDELNKITSLEKEINTAKGNADEVILIAFENKN